MHQFVEGDTITENRAGASVTGTNICLLDDASILEMLRCAAEAYRDSSCSGIAVVASLAATGGVAILLSLGYVP